MIKLVPFDETYLLKSIDWHKNKDIADGIGLWNESYTDDELKNMVLSWLNDKSTLIYGIEKDSQPVGYIMLKNINPINKVAEIHLAVCEKETQNRMTAYVATKEILKKAFNGMGINCVVAYSIDNPRTTRMLDRGLFGFQYEGYLKDRVLKKDKFAGLYMYSVNKRDFKEN